tara:strand:- start:389 stop:862 length:474 start_codon:yes stop_codon:yes gene_type:complete
MIEQIYTYFSIEMIYLWLNIGVLPFWFLLIFLPETKICKIFVSSIFPILIFSTIDLYLIFELYKSDYNLFDSFNLYLGLDELSDLLSDKNFLILFWIHFLAINLFCGSWIVRDYQRLNITKLLVIVPLILTYLIGPLGIFMYWLIRIFFSKKIDLYD